MYQANSLSSTIRLALASALALSLILLLPGCSDSNQGTTAGVAVLEFDAQTGGATPISTPLLCVEMNSGDKIAATVSGNLLEQIMDLDAITEALNEGGPFNLWVAEDMTYYIVTDANPDTVHLEQTSDGWQVTSIEGVSSESNTSDENEDVDTTQEDSEDNSTGTVSEPDLELSIQEHMNATYGWFSWSTLKGFQSMTVDLPPEASACIVTVHYEDPSGLTLWSVDSSGHTVDVLFDGTGPYEETIFCQDFPQIYILVEETLDSWWEIRFAPVSYADVLHDAPMTRTGDAVLLYDGPETTWHVVYTGEDSFTVKTGTTQLIDHIGSYDSSIVAPAGPSVVIIKASGDWSITPE